VALWREFGQRRVHKLFDRPQRVGGGNPTLWIDEGQHAGLGVRPSAYTSTLLAFTAARKTHPPSCQQPVGGIEGAGGRSARCLARSRTPGGLRTRPRRGGPTLRSESGRLRRDLFDAGAPPPHPLAQPELPRVPGALKLARVEAQSSMSEIAPIVEHMFYNAS
jgi:hypothetical protein